MSRRTSITRIQSQQRAASRMTRGTKMWTEQPQSEGRDRWRATAPPPDEEKEWFPPQSLTYHKRQGGAPQTYDLHLLKGQQAVFVCSVRTGGGGREQPITIGAGWTVLLDQKFGVQRTVVVTRTSTSDSTTTVCSTPPKTFLWNELGMAGFIITPDPVSKQQYNISVNGVWQTVDNGFTIHQWTGPFNGYRLRALTAYGLYANWSPGYNGDESGHYRSQMGYLSPQTCWYTPYGPPGNPLAYLTTPWATGYWRHRSIGAVGTPHWTEHHIALVPK